MKDIVILGNGLLGSELVNQTGWDCINRSEHGFDITNINQWIMKSGRHYGFDQYHTIINCIADTKTYSTDKTNHWKVNYEGVSKLVDYCNRTDKKLIHISTDYVYSNSKTGATEEDVPVHCENWYGYTKLLAEGYIQLKLNNYLIIRTTHKPYPFPYNKAIVNQIGNFEYVQEITKIIVKLINKNVEGIFNVGTDIKTMYELAKQSNSDIEPMYELMNESTPKNVVMDLTKLKNFLNE